MADLQKTYDDGAAARANTQARALVTAEVARMTAAKTASQTLAASEATAVAGLFVARYDEAETAAAGMATSWSLPWIQYQAAKAAAEADWAPSAAGNYATLRASLATADAAYSTTVVAAYATRGNALADARLAADLTDSLEAKTRTHAEANADRDYELATAEGRRDHAVDVAVANKSYNVALATVDKDDLEGNLGGLTRQEARDLAKQARGLLGDQAADAFGEIEAPGRGDWTGAVSTAQQDFLEDTADGQLLLLQTEAEANYDYAVAEINAHHTRALAALEIEASFLEDTAGSYSLAIDDFADYDGSPWSAQDRDLAAAEKDRVDDEQAANRVLRTDWADEDQAADLQKALARQVFDNARATAGHTKILALSEAAVERLFAESGAVETLAAAGYYLGENDLPGGVGVDQLVPLVQGDYWHATGYDDYYLGAVDRAFQYVLGLPMADPGFSFEGWENALLFSHSGYGDLTEQLDLPDDPSNPNPGPANAPGALTGKRALPKPKGDVSSDITLDNSHSTLYGIDGGRIGPAEPPAGATGAIDRYKLTVIYVQEAAEGDEAQDFEIHFNSAQTSSSAERGAQTRFGDYLDGLLPSNKAERDEILAKFKRIALNSYNAAKTGTVADSLKNQLEYKLGVVEGFFKDGFVGSLSDIADLLVLGAKASNYTPTMLVARWIMGDRFESEAQSLRELGGKAAHYAVIALQIAELYYVGIPKEMMREAGILLSGSPQELSQLGEDHRMAAALMLEITAQVSDVLANLTPRQKGRIVGAILYEVALELGAAAVTAEAGGAGALATGSVRFAGLSARITKLLRNARKGSDLARVADLFSDTGKLTELFRHLDRMMDKAHDLNKLRAKTPDAPQSPGLKSKLPIFEFAEHCFAAGTPVLTPHGHKAIDQLRPGDVVLARREDDEYAPVEPRCVEAVFELAAEIIEIEIEGQRIRTTAEHRFFIHGRGWLSTVELQVGDLLVSHDGQRLPVAAIVHPGVVERVYNIRVAEDHTYFVGARDWGFSAWAHNDYSVKPLGDGKFHVVDHLGRPAQNKTTGQPAVFDSIDEANSVKDRANQALKSLEAGGVQGTTRRVAPLKGPGEFATIVEGMSERAAAYQRRVTGLGENVGYVVKGTKFDGFDEVAGVLLDAKGPGYAKFVKDGIFRPWWRGAEKLVQQAQRQLLAAGGTPIRWLVAERVAADAIRNLLRSRGITEIDVVFTP